MALPDHTAHACVARDVFGRMPDGHAVERIRLRGSNGFEVSIITYGAAVQALFVADRRGVTEDVVLGHDDLGSYIAARNFFGATIGRYANRIAAGSFCLDGSRYDLPKNDGPNSLHGGSAGFDRHVWTIEDIGERPAPFVVLSRVSPHGEQGYPGTLTARVVYSLTDAQELTISFEASTDRPTVVNLTHHGFFNLGGVANGRDILDHKLTIYADTYLPVDAAAIPVGRPVQVAGTPLDFRTPKRIGTHIRNAHDQLRLCGGYDHNFCLIGERTGKPRLAARLEDPVSGRAMEIHTDQPGLQFYSGNFLDGRTKCSYDRLPRQSDALCLEPQAWPDAPNRMDFPPARLDPGEIWHHLSIYRFLTA